MGVGRDSMRRTRGRWEPGRRASLSMVCRKPSAPGVGEENCPWKSVATWVRDLASDNVCGKNQPGKILWPGKKESG